TWTLSSGLSYTPTKNFELRLGGAVGLMTSGKVHPVDCPNPKGCGRDATYDYGTDIVSAISLSGKLKF
ncbi:MAG: transporter, partial [Alphaproteobacteria bacterium]